MSLRELIERLIAVAEHHPSQPFAVGLGFKDPDGRLMLVSMDLRQLFVVAEASQVILHFVPPPHLEEPLLETLEDVAEEEADARQDEEGLAF